MSRRERAGRSGKPEREAGGQETAREALERARVHASNAVSEGLSAVRALLDAASLAATGSPADANPTLQRVTKSIEALAEQLRSGGAGVSPALVDAVLDALDTEIARWELRSKEDSEARPVLRAFLGVREILWEVGLRRNGGGAEKQPEAPPSSAEARQEEQATEDGSRRRRQRVQRLDVQG